VGRGYGISSTLSLGAWISMKKPREQFIASTKVRCGRHMHTIGLTPRGALVLCDHPDVNTELALVALGAPTPYCLSILQSWRDGDYAILPDEIYPALIKALERRDDRQRAARESADPLEVPFHIRAKERVRAMAEEALRQCGYRRSHTMWVGGEHIVTAYIGEPDIVGSSSGVWRLGFHGTNGWIDVTIRLSWYSRVYRRGLAVVGGSFVLDVIAEDEKGLIVLAGRQGRGYDVHPARARVFVDESGEYRLVWLRDVK